MNTILNKIPIKIAIVGSRGFVNKKLLWERLNNFKTGLYYRNYYISEVITGGAKGADILGELWAKDNGIKCTVHKPDWNKHGKSAGFIRNKLIVNDCDYLIAFWDGKSKGTEHSLNLAKSLDKKTIIYEFDLNRQTRDVIKYAIKKITTYYCTDDDGLISKEYRNIVYRNNFNFKVLHFIRRELKNENIRIINFNSI